MFEVTLNNNIIYTNKNQCGRLPTLGEIFSKIYKGATAKSNAGNDPSEGGMYSLLMLLIICEVSPS